MKLRYMSSVLVRNERGNCGTALVGEYNRVI